MLFLCSHPIVSLVLTPLPIQILEMHSPPPLNPLAPYAPTKSSRCTGPTSRILFLRLYALSSLLQVDSTQSAVKKEQGLVSKLKEEINAVNSNAQQQMQLEQEKAEATAAEKALVEKTLDAERQKVRRCCREKLIKLVVVRDNTR